MALQLAILSGIVALWVVSSKRDGIVAVPDTPSSLFDSGGVSMSSARLWTYALLWTFLPTFILSRYGDCFGAVLDELKSSQPTMELCSPSGSWEPTCHAPGCGKEHRWEGKWELYTPLRFLPVIFKYHHRMIRRRRQRATPQQTILLDYGSLGYSLPIYNAWRALGNRHFLVAACMLVKSALSVASALASSILAVATVVTSVSVTLHADSYVFDSWDLSSTYSNSTSLRPAFDLVSATVVNYASPLPWMTPSHSFRPFYGDFSPEPLSTVTALTTAYSATLDCDILDPQALGRAGEVYMEGQVGSADGVVNFNFTHRGCAVFKWLRLMEAPSTVYVRSWAVTDCSLASGRMRYGFFAGVSDASAALGLSNLTLVACQPVFWNSSALVTVSAASSPAPSAPKTSQGQSPEYGQVISSSILHSDPFILSSYGTYLGDMPLYAPTDPSEEFSMDTVGRLSYDCATEQNATDALSSTLLTAAFQTVYGAVFATMVRLAGLKHTNTNTNTNSTSTSTSTSPPADAAAPVMDGLLSMPQNRLFVVRWPAAAVMAAVAAAFLVTVWTAFYAAINAPALLQRQDLILGHAMMVMTDHPSPDSDSDMARYIAAVKADALQCVRDGGEDEEGRRSSQYTGEKNSAQIKPPPSSDDEQRSLRGKDLVEHAGKAEGLRDWECWLEGDEIRLRKVPYDDTGVNPGNQAV
ncbi:hypothetical protein B0T26DRAFT_752000 [Lasiosphaeria miniovina]|uniref:Uncharacterized protein n=1 Tax=Lasiosphaeria miniovina TaxID=1954250 RepID=A0AA40ALF4_9PEZI|nr:uncharacterized protein B0T26DRAFT_752000 [Lasiosphaeria miniovina]KAK0718018.1 hypothetical protein B0T26DRAFT_752000 [Lasiosphaeria miniovina]